MRVRLRVSLRLRVRAQQPNRAGDDPDGRPIKLFWAAQQVKKAVDAFQVSFPKFVWSRRLFRVRPSVCMSVCLSVCLSDSPRSVTASHKNGNYADC